MGELSMRVLVIQEDGAWIAQALEFDIGVQASDLDCLKRRFEMTVDVELEESIRRSGTPFGGLSPAPDHYFELWEKSSTDFKSSGEAGNSDAPQRVELHGGAGNSNLPHINYEMKIAA